eukprot:6175806-Pleurochrysis_carterae.AAC.1
MRRRVAVCVIDRHLRFGSSPIVARERLAHRVCDARTEHRDVPRQIRQGLGGRGPVGRYREAEICLQDRGARRAVDFALQFAVRAAKPGEVEGTVYQSRIARAVHLDGEDVARDDRHFTHDGHISRPIVDRLNEHASTCPANRRARSTLHARPRMSVSLTAPVPGTIASSASGLCKTGIVDIPLEALELPGHRALIRKRSASSPMEVA